MLASGADVKIGTREFMLATDVEEPYVYMAENLYPTQAEVAGTDKKTANQNILLWSYDNWAGGGQQDFYDPDQPTRWWTQQSTNTRNPGAIQSSPTRTTATNITTGVTPNEGIFVTAGGNLWYFTGDQGYYSTDGATWTENSDISNELPLNYQITAAASDGEYAYIAASDGTNRGIWRVTSTTVADDFVTAHANTAAYKSIAVKDGFVHAWTGNALLRYQADATLPITHSLSLHRKFKVGAEAPAGTFFSDMTTGESSVVFMRSWAGNTTLYEYKVDLQTNKLGARSFWTLPTGFTGKKICVNTGIIYVLGEYTDKTALFGYSTVSRQPLFLGFIEDQVSAGNIRFLSPSYGAQVLIGIDNGTTSLIYVYDAEEDAFSELDEVSIASIGTMTAGATYKNRRVIGSFATTTTKITRWVLDTDTPAGTWVWTSSAWDLNYPQDEKVLLGFHIVQDPAIASGTVNIDYQLDEDDVWLDAGTTSAASKHTYIQVSDGTTTRKFRTLRMRMNGTAGCRVLSITARAYVNTKQEVWRLMLDLRNEPGTQRHPSTRTSRAATLRDYLRTLVSTGSVVTFLDGRRYPQKSGTNNTGYSTHTCLIEFPKDAIDSATEGKCEVILRSVSPSA